jgi:hypothetical protein
MGERLDPEWGLHHLAHAACCVLYILDHELGVETVLEPADPDGYPMPAYGCPQARVFTRFGLSSEPSPDVQTRWTTSAVTGRTKCGKNDTDPDTPGEAPSSPDSGAGAPDDSP